MSDTATPETAPVEADLDSIIAELEGETAEDSATEPEAETSEADEPEAGDAVKAPAREGEEAPDEAKKPEAEAEAQAIVKVKVNGEEREVPLEEALKGYSRTEDYKAKTERLAQDRVAFERQYAEQLQTVASQFAAFDPILSKAASTDWAALSRDDPAEYVALREAVAQRQQYLGAVQAEVARVNAAETQATLDREYQALVKAMPQLAEPETARQFDRELRDHLKATYQFDDETINSVEDHRFYIIADKARKYDAIQAARTTLPARKVTPVATVKAVRPGAEAPRSTPRKPGPGATDSQFADWAARHLALE